MNPDRYICNRCYKPMKSSNSLFSITQCGHIFCSDCTMPDSCPRCNLNGIRVIELTNPLPTSVRHLFADPVSSLQQLSTTMELQIHQLTEMEKKYKKMKNANRKVAKTIRKLRQINNELLKAQNKSQVAHELPQSNDSDKS